MQSCRRRYSRRAARIILLLVFVPACFTYSSPNQGANSSHKKKPSQNLSTRVYRSLFSPKHVPRYTSCLENRGIHGTHGGTRRRVRSTDKREDLGGRVGRRMTVQQQYRYEAPTLNRVICSLNSSGVDFQAPGARLVFLPQKSTESRTPMIERRRASSHHACARHGERDFKTPDAAPSNTARSGSSATDHYTPLNARNFFRHERKQHHQA